MRLMPIITMINNAVSALDYVGPARSLAAVPDDAVLPSAYVHPMVDKATSNNLLGMNVSQEKDAQFGVLIAAKNVNTVSGVEELEDIREAISAAILGKQPTANHGPIEYLGGQIADVDSQRIYWREVYQSVDLLRA